MSGRGLMAADRDLAQHRGGDVRKRGANSRGVDPRGCPEIGGRRPGRLLDGFLNVWLWNIFDFHCIVLFFHFGTGDRKSVP